MDLGEINNIITQQVPISGLTMIGEEIVIVFDESATAEQRELGQQLLAGMPLYFAKKEKINQIDAEYESVSQIGWDSGQGFRLGMKHQDVSLLVGLFVLAKEGAAMGFNPPPVIDTDGVAHNFTMQELTTLMLQYGQARSQLAITDANKRKAVANATTIEQVNQI